MPTPTEPRSLVRLFHKLTGWIVYIPLTIAIVTGLIAMFEGRKADRLASDGAVASASITDKRIEISTDSDGDKTTTYYLDFTFAHERNTVRDSESVSRSFYNSLDIGDTAPVRYWQPDPQVNELEPGSTTQTIWVTKIISAIALAGAVLWGERCWRKARRAIRVRDRGVRRRAEITAHLSTGVRVNKQPQYRLGWRDSEGREGRSFMMGRAKLADFPVGMALDVYADPAGRLPSVWEGDVGQARAARGAVRRR